jgi:antitoxin component of RelBE/YafQ-DinJ toxin-antitoxin module
MSKTPPKRKPGRPREANPKTTLVSFRIDDATRAAIEAEREAMGVETFSVSDTVREMTVRALKKGGRL